MLELTPENAGEYLVRRGFVAPGPVRVTELADGVSNAVLRIETGTRKFVLKQSRPRLRTRDDWFSDLDRVWRERDVLRYLGPLLPPEAVPHVIFDDPENYAFAMSHAPEPFRNWRSVLLSGEVDLKLGEEAGRLLGLIHEQSAANPPTQFADCAVFEQLRVDPFYVRIQQRLPDVAELIAPLVERCRTVRLGLCHGDFSPKNLLAHAGGFTLVDHETAHWGDVTFDLGFFLSHLILKSVHLSECRDEFFELTWSFWKGYFSVVTFAPEWELVWPGIQHLGACLLARIDGTSPAPYLIDGAKREEVRWIGRELLRSRPGTWGGALVCAGDRH
jgi:5-methylthioribose kinase